MTTAAIISLVSGILIAFGGVLFNYFKINKIAKENEYINIINLQRKDILDFKTEINKLHEKIESLNKVVKELDSALLRSNAISLSFPFPFWYKSSASGKMKMLNDEYCRTYKKCREDYIGKTDFEVWDEETAKLFTENDKAVLNSQLGYRIDYNNEIEDTLIIKWRIPGLTRDEYYIAGISVPYKFIEDAKPKS